MQRAELWTWISRPFAAGLIAGTMILLGSFLAVKEEPEPEPPQLLPATPLVSASPQVETSWDEHQIIRVQMEDGGTEEMALNEYLWRVVAAEMPASFEAEALKAQAVCARTYTLWKMKAGIHADADLCSSSGCCQAYTTREQAQERWEDLSDVYTARIASAVSETDGQVLTYEGEPIQAVFFSSSVSSTEDAAQVWGSALPYLVSVDSPEGEDVPNYHSTVTLTSSELSALVRSSGLGADLSGDPAGWIRNVSYNESGRVAELDVGGVTLSGGAARTLFGLRSACFTVEQSGGVFTFSVTGYGHGVGMSQYGANAMAKEGKSWQEIVAHYYTGIEIQEKQ